MRFLSTFEQSFATAVAYYISVDRPLARRFVDAADEAMRSIGQFPGIGQQVRGYRVLPLRGFPYSFCYKVDRNGPIALVLHHHKQSGAEY